MKDISKLFETIMDFKGLSFLVTEQSLMKKQRPVFFAIVRHAQFEKKVAGRQSDTHQEFCNDYF